MMADQNFSDAAVYVISVAAELAGMHPQTLRQYDRLGLVTPQRTKGRGRRYSAHDIEMLREVQRLSQEEGMNLAGIAEVMELRRKVRALSTENRQLKKLLAEVKRVQERIFAVSPFGETVETDRNPRRTPSPEVDGRELIRYRWRSELIRPRQIL